jgi:hypothetical protein
MDNINGLMNCVFAFGGATLFNELMAEMRSKRLMYSTYRFSATDQT